MRKIYLLSNMENKENIKDFIIKELEIIQGIINRMAHNSFLIKWWTITLVVVLLLLKENKYYTFQ